MGNTTETITYEIEIDADKATASGKKIGDTFKNVSDSAAGAKKSTGDYGQALDKLAPGVQSSVQGFGGLLSSFKALALSPVGLTLTAVAGAIAVIKAGIEKCEPALDFIEDIMTKISTTANTLLMNVDKLGSILGNLFAGNLAGASAAFDQLTDSISENNKIAQDYLNRSRDLEDAQVAFKISTADTENQIKALIIASKNRNLSFDEAQSKIEQAMKLEKGLTDQRVKLAQEEAEINVTKIALDRDLKKQQDESFDDFVKRITASGKLSFEQASQVADYYAKIKQAESDTLAFREKTQNRLDEIQNKRMADFESAGKKLLALNDIEDAVEKQREERAIKEQQRIDERNKAVDLNAQNDEEKFQSEVNRIISLGQQEIETDNKVTNQQIDNQLKIEKAKKDEQKLDFLVGQQKLANAATVLNQIAGIIDKNSAAYKVLAISQASIDTFRAATAALAPPPVGAGPLFGPVLAASTIALGLANVAKIAGFAEGGLSGTRILSGMGRPISRSNGDNMLATVRTGEVILNERQQAALGGASTFAAIGVPGFATGGITDTQLNNSLNNSFTEAQLNNDRNVNNLISVVKASSQRVLVIEDVENLINQRIAIRENATL